MMKIPAASCATLLALSGLVLTVMPALAKLPREHDGFFMRLSAGAGGARTEIKDVPFQDEQVDLEMNGTAGDFNFAIGGVVARNLALHGTISGWSVSDPDFEINGTKFDTNDVTLSLAMFGAGLTYYFMPANIYISGSLGAGILTLTVDGDDEDSDPGPAVDLSAGKEWWVGKSWGLGVALGTNFHSIPSSDTDENFTGSSYAVRFSATFN
jgi:hypothetical protein